MQAIINLMRMMMPHRLRGAALLLAWLLLTTWLIQAPVWDEQNMLLWLARQSFGEAWQAIWLQAPGGVVRPLPQLMVLVIWHALGGREYPAFAALRLVTAACHGLGVFLLFSRSPGFRGAGFPREPQRFLPDLLLGAVLFSQSGLAIAGWFATIYDAMVTLCLGLAIHCAKRRQWLGSGICLGLGFFCKESMLLGLVILPILGLLPDKRIERLRLLTPLLAGMLGYAAWRQQRIALGSAADLHGFSLHQVSSAAYGLLAGLPFGGVPANAWLALAGCVLSLLWWWSLRAPARLGAVLLWLFAAALYSGMLPAAGARPLIHWAHFQGRLFALPLLLAALATLRHGRHPRQTGIMMLMTLLIPGAAFLHDHMRFQQLYRCMAIEARERHGLMVHFPEKPLEGEHLELRIDDAPQATCRLEPWNGTLTCNGRVICPMP